MVDKTDLIEKLDDILADPVTNWREGSSYIINADHLKIYTSDVNVFGYPLKPQEICFRVQALIKDIAPVVCYTCFEDSEIRQQWDEKVDQLKIIESNGNELIKHYIIKATFPLVVDRDVVIRE